MIRPTTPDDIPAVLTLTVASGLFQENETEALAGLLAEYFSNEPDTQDIWLTDDEDGPVGVIYVAPERMTEGTWNVYLIAVHPDYQKQGRGAALLAHVEHLLADRGERILLVETSGLESFEYVRAFYRTCGYDEEARIREFYKPGEDKIIFRKTLTTLDK